MYYLCNVKKHRWRSDVGQAGVKPRSKSEVGCITLKPLYHFNKP